MISPAPSLQRPDIQGLALHAYKHLDFAAYLLVGIESAAGSRRWLAAHAGQVTTAAGKSLHEGFNLAFTHAGLSALLPARAQWLGFSAEFSEGMVTPVRQRVLGDHSDGPNAPELWRWGGPTTPPVHVLLLLFARDADALEQRVRLQTSAMAQNGLRVHQVLYSHPLAQGREHFGFHDGISNPVISTRPEQPNEVHAGEFILGYENESAAVPPVPGLAGAQPFPQWGRNGSYVVFRQISQDVNGFWTALQALTAQGGPAPLAPRATVRLAAKMIGRWPDGAPLALFPDPPVAALPDQDPRLDRFGFRESDRAGLRCPFGAHIRRANPRDALGENSAASLQGVNKHRLLRRGRAYGTPVTPYTGPQETAVASMYPGAPATEDRGLLFMSMVADLKSQFEFVQQTWLNSRKFPDALDSFDPIAGAPGRRANQRVTTFVAPACPVREHYTDFASFIRTIGGAYFFLPGLAALHTLASLSDE